MLLVLSYICSRMVLVREKRIFSYRHCYLIYKKIFFRNKRNSDKFTKLNDQKSSYLCNIGV